MQQHQRRKEGVQVHVEGIAPFNVRLQAVCSKVPVCNCPEEGGDDDAHKDAVHKDHVKDEGYALPEGESQHVRRIPEM